MTIRNFGIQPTYSFKSGSYLTQKGLEEFEENCLDQEPITEAIKKSDELIKTIRHHSVLLNSYLMDHK